MQDDYNIKSVLKKIDYKIYYNLILPKIIYFIYFSSQIKYIIIENY